MYLNKKRIELIKVCLFVFNKKIKSNQVHVKIFLLVNDLFLQDELIIEIFLLNMLLQFQLVQH